MKRALFFFTTCCIFATWTACHAENSGDISVLQTDRVTVERVRLEGEDLARAMNVRVYKYTTSLPEGEYTIRYWHEKYAPSNRCPEILSGGSSTGRRPAIREILIKLPTPESKSACFYVGGGGSRTEEILDTDLIGSSSISALDKETFSFDELKEGIILFVDIWAGKITGGTHQQHVLDQNLENDYKRIVVYKMAIERGI